MKKGIALILIVASLSCNTNRQAAAGTQVGLLNLSHYYLKNSVELNSNYNGMVIANENDFQTLFYIENPTGKNVPAPDFKGQLVVALALNRTGNDKMVFAKAEILNNEINVYSKEETVKCETDSPVAIAALPNYSDAKKVNFFVDGVLVKSVSFSVDTSKREYASGAKNYQLKTPVKEERKLFAII